MGCHNDTHAHPRRIEQIRRELERHSNAAMGCRTTWQNASMECDAGPGDALHVRHIRIVIQAGIVLGILLDDAVSRPFWPLDTGARTIQPFAS
jgi:hypothetical protein